MAGWGSGHLLCSQKDFVKVWQDLLFYNQAKPVPIVGAKINCSQNPLTHHSLLERNIWQTSGFMLENQPIRVHLSQSIRAQLWLFSSNYGYSELGIWQTFFQSKSINHGSAILTKGLSCADGLELSCHSFICINRSAWEPGQELLL